MLEIKYTKTDFNDLDKIFKLIFESYNIYYSIEKDYIKILKIINAKQLQKK